MTNYRTAINNLALVIAEEIKKDYCGTNDNDTLAEASDRYVLDSVEQLKKLVLRKMLK